MKALHITSLRAKLFLAAIAVQVLMLVALTTQSLDFLNAKLEERAQLRLDEEKSLLVTSLADPVKRRDFAAADVARKALQERGVVIEDTAKGTRWKRVRT